MNNPRYLAFSTTFPFITRQLQTNLFVSDGLLARAEAPEKSGAKEYVAIWDTGASSTAISKKVVSDLMLPVVSMGTTSTAAGMTDTTIHRVHLWLPNYVVIEKCRANCVPGLEDILGVDLLIGMDVMCQGDLAISNFQEKTVLSFRIPSVATTDYVKESAPARNGPCPCGSGKKYKHCHGK
jgi:predicted aspartyl protease